MEKKEKKNLFILYGVLFALMLVICGLFIWYSTMDKVDENVSPTPTVTIAPTATVAPTNTATPEPTNTVTPEPTATSIPSPTPTNTPSPSATTTPTIAIPVVTAAPTATPTPVVEVLAKFQVGPEAWYTFYADNTLVVSGTGEVDNYIVNDWQYIESDGEYFLMWRADGCEYDGKVDELYLASALHTVNTIVIEEGITAINEVDLSECVKAKFVAFPSTLESINQAAFAYLGANTENGVTIVGLDDSKVDVHPLAFYGAKFAEDSQDVVVVATPTATPTPLPPDPENPKLLCTARPHSKCKIEYYDNGHVYTSGTGIGYSPSGWYERPGLPADYVGTHFHIGEGITDPHILSTAKYVWLPTTIDLSDENVRLFSLRISSECTYYIYYKGVPYTVKFSRSAELEEEYAGYIIEYYNEYMWNYVREMFENDVVNRGAVVEKSTTTENKIYIQHVVTITEGH